MVIKHSRSPGATAPYWLLITKVQQLATSADVNIFNNINAGVLSGPYAIIDISIHGIGRNMRHDLNHRISPTELLWCGCDVTDDITGMRGR